MRAQSLLPLLALTLGLSPLAALAASVTQVKGTKLMIQLDGLQTAPGAELYILNEDGKKVGLVQVKQVRGDKALAEITKGRATAGAQVQVKGAGGGATAAGSATTDTGSGAGASGSSASKKGKKVGGILAGYAMNNMSLTAQYNAGNKEDLTMKDSGFSLKGFYDYEVSPAFTIRASTGLEMFSVKGTTTINICENGTSKSCEVSFNYLAAEASAHYNLTNGSFKAWVGLGYSFLFAVSKKSNVPNLSSDSSTNQMILISTGADIWTSKTAFFPVVVEYGMFPGSSNVKADAIFVRGGYGFTF
jgi:hypothetical protein